MHSTIRPAQGKHVAVTLKREPDPQIAPEGLDFGAALFFALGCTAVTG
jgi:hypothetical protein